MGVGVGVGVAVGVTVGVGVGVLLGVGAPEGVALAEDDGDGGAGLGLVAEPARLGEGPDAGLKGQGRSDWRWQRPRSVPRWRLGPGRL